MGVYLFTALFYLLLFLLMCGTLLCGHVCTTAGKESSEAGNTIDLFKAEDFKGAKGPGGELEAKAVTVNDFYCPVLLLSGDYVVALAGVNRIDTGKPNINIVTKYIEKNKLFGSKDGLQLDGGWETQFAVQTDEAQEAKKVVKGLLAAAKGDKIYLLMVKTSINTEGGDAQETVSAVDFGFAVGDFVTGDDRKITWGTGKELTSSAGQTFTEKIKKEKLSNGAFSGSVLVTEEKVIFLLKVQTESKKTIFAFFNLEKTKDKFKLLNDKTIAGLYSFFQWKDKIFRTPHDDTSSGDDNKEVMEFNANSNKFENAGDPIARLRDFLKNKSSFVTAKIEGSDVLFFIQQKYVQSAGKNVVYLWMTDGTRVVDVETIVPEFKGTFYGSLLHANNELFLLYQTAEEGDEKSNKIYLARLNEELTKLTDTLKDWNKSNVDFKQRCGGTDITVIPCFTDGLVGFLSNTKEDSAGGIIKWKDDYFNMDPAMIIVGVEKKGEATKVQNGFKFSGVGAGARWSVGEQSQDQPYNFTDPGFTLVATVTINDNVKNARNSVLGVVFKPTDNAGESTKSVGLWCTEKTKKWAISDKNNEEENKENLKESKDECEQGTTYNVAFVLKEDGNLELYINGQPPKNLENKNIRIEKGGDIKYFYFAVDSDEQPGANSDVTITNVLLYNRPFTTAEVEQLKPKLNTAAGDQTQHESDSSNLQNSTGSTTQTKQPPGTSANESENKTRSSSAEDSAARVGVVGVLSLLFGVFTLLGRYVY